MRSGLPRGFITHLRRGASRGEAPHAHVQPPGSAEAFGLELGYGLLSTMGPARRQRHRLRRKEDKEMRRAGSTALDQLMVFGLSTGGRRCDCRNATTPPVLLPCRQNRILPVSAGTERGESGSLGDRSDAEPSCNAPPCPGPTPHPDGQALRPTGVDVAQAPPPR